MVRLAMVKAAQCNLRETELKVGLDEKRLKQEKELDENRLKQEKELQERRFLLEEERMREESAKTQASKVTMLSLSDQAPNAAYI